MDEDINDQNQKVKQADSLLMQCDNEDTNSKNKREMTLQQEKDALNSLLAKRNSVLEEQRKSKRETKQRITRSSLTFVRNESNGASSDNGVKTIAGTDQVEFDLADIAEEIRSANALLGSLNVRRLFS